MTYTQIPHQHGEKNELELIQSQIDLANNFQIVADIFKQLGDTTRIRIFWLLCHCEECVINISAMLKVSSPAVSHHLRPLKSSGLITCRRDGKEVYYRAADTEQSRLLHKMIEQVMEIACPGLNETKLCEVGHLIEYQSEQVETVRRVHDYLTENIGQRITIETLARQFLINPTTLKKVFRSVYGNSLASHIKEHRMELAAQLLRETDLSMAQISEQIGYESQSKFTAAFKAYYDIPPTEYRKNREHI